MGLIDKATDAVGDAMVTAVGVAGPVWQKTKDVAGDAAVAAAGAAGPVWVKTKDVAGDCGRRCRWRRRPRLGQIQGRGRRCGGLGGADSRSGLGQDKGCRR